jgi:integrase
MRTSLRHRGPWCPGSANSLRIAEAFGARCRIDDPRQTIYYGEKDTPKSGHQRKVPLTDRLYGLLFEAAQRPHRLATPVAPSSKGTIWGESSLNHAFKAVLKRVKLPPSRLHALRHHFVSQCFRVGGSAPTVQALAGHRHMQVTARYAHTDDDAKRGVIAAFSRRSRQDGQQMVNRPSETPKTGDASA